MGSLIELIRDSGADEQAMSTSVVTARAAVRVEFADIIGSSIRLSVWRLRPDASGPEPVGPARHRRRQVRGKVVSSVLARYMAFLTTAGGIHATQPVVRESARVAPARA